MGYEWMNNYYPQNRWDNPQGDAKAPIQRPMFRMCWKCGQKGHKCWSICRSLPLNRFRQGLIFHNGRISIAQPPTVFEGAVPGKHPCSLSVGLQSTTLPAVGTLDGGIGDYLPATPDRPLPRQLAYERGKSAGTMSTNQDSPVIKELQTPAKTPRNRSIRVLSQPRPRSSSPIPANAARGSKFSAYTRHRTCISSLPSRRSAAATMLSRLSAT